MSPRDLRCLAIIPILILMIRMDVAPPIALPPENLFRIADAPTNSAKAPPIPANPLPISSQLILANI